VDEEVTRDEGQGTRKNNPGEERIPELNPEKKESRN
jgi:hypothetical protein